MPRVKSQKQKQQHPPLGDELDNDKRFQQYGQVTRPKKRAHKARDVDEEEHVEVNSFHWNLGGSRHYFQVLDEKSSRAIMKLALEQQQEEKEDDDEEEEEVPRSKQPRAVRIVEDDESDEDEENIWVDEDYDAELVRQTYWFITCLTNIIFFSGN